MSLYDYSEIDCRVDDFSPQTRGVISDSITQNWTRQALECYAKKCDCTNCSISKYNYSFVCQMPKIIDTLLKTHGKPRVSRLAF